MKVDALPILIALLSGVVAAIVAIVKLKPEGDQILVSSAKDVVLIQKGALDDLRAEMANMERRFQETLAATRTNYERVLHECNQERDGLVRQRDDLRRKSDHLAERVDALEKEVAELRQRRSIPGARGRRGDQGERGDQGQRGKRGDEAP